MRRLPAETTRLQEDASRVHNWKRWGPYLSERQWGTVREDYSEGGTAWDYFPHDHARSRAYRWGEDGLLGISDREGRLCFGLALWNGRDPILKERLFGLTGSEGNHGEDVKECYYYLDSTPTHSYMKALYKYPQAAFPYARLVEENRRRGLDEPEYELADTGVFDDDRYFDVFAEYAKAGPDDMLIRLTVVNRAPEAATITLLPTLWSRNTWSWGRDGQEGYWPRPVFRANGEGGVVVDHASLGRWHFVVGAPASGVAPELLFTENDTNVQRLYDAPLDQPYVKDAFHAYVVEGRTAAVNPGSTGSKVAALYRLDLGPGERATVCARLFAAEAAPAVPLGPEFDTIFATRAAEADEFYAAHIPEAADDDERAVIRQGYAGLLWTKQFFHFVVRDWLEGDPAQPSPPPARRTGRNHDWEHLYNRDVISMPDAWEYPWYAAWDLAFHMIPFARIDPDFAKQQLLLFLREWYMHPNGQLPAYEWAFNDVNPPVHAWACWRVYKMTGAKGQRDRVFLARVFHKLLLNFTWWVNRKDPDGRNLFAGGFLGLDNIGVFDRSAPLPTGGHLEQADGTAWMAFYCGTLLSMALELASEDPAYEDVASKFLEHFVAITDAVNTLAGTGLWDDEDGFYYDQLHLESGHLPLRVRSLVGLMPLVACEILDEKVIARLPQFTKRMRWFLANRPELADRITCLCAGTHEGNLQRLLAVPSRDRLERILGYLLNEEEFLSPYGIRSVSKVHADHPFVFVADGAEYRVDYAPGEGQTRLFGGNSNWRGPIWFPLNYLIIEALERYHRFYGDTLTVECPTGSGNLMTLDQAAAELASRLGRIFLPDPSGYRPCHGSDPRYAHSPHWKDLVLFHEYFHGDSGRGLGASHQTGWTALAIKCLEETVRTRTHDQPQPASGTRDRMVAATAVSAPPQR